MLIVYSSRIPNQFSGTHQDKTSENLPYLFSVRNRDRVIRDYSIGRQDVRRCRTVEFSLANIEIHSSISPSSIQSTHSIPRTDGMSFTIDKTNGLVRERHIVVAIDDSSDSENALRWAVSHVYEAGVDCIHLVHIAANAQHSLEAWTSACTSIENSNVGVGDSEEFIKHRFAQILVHESVPFLLHIVVGKEDTGHIAAMISEKARDIGADVIVIGKHRYKSFIKKAFLGSVAKNLVLISPVPVCVVPP